MSDKEDEFKNIDWDQILGKPMIKTDCVLFRFCDCGTIEDLYAVVEKVKNMLADFPLATNIRYNIGTDSESYGFDEMEILFERPETLEEQKDSYKKWARAVREAELMEQRRQELEYETFLELKKKYEGEV